jgi:hypothetical protein
VTADGKKSTDIRPARARYEADVAVLRAGAPSAPSLRYDAEVERLPAFVSAERAFLYAALVDSIARETAARDKKRAPAMKKYFARALLLYIERSVPL